MQVGDLVKIAPYCLTKGQLAVVVRLKPCKEAVIRYVDKSLHDERGETVALLSNLEPVK